MKKEIDSELVARIMDVLKDTDRDHPIKRADLLARLPCSDREMRWTYSMMPEVGELGDGLFIKRTSLDWKHHTAKMKKTIKATADRIRRCQQAEQDLHQENLKWLHQEFIRRGECPAFLIGGDK